MAADLAGLGLRDRLSPDEVERLAAAATADPDPRARAAAVAALSRHAAEAGPTVASIWNGAATDTDATVRRRAAEVAPECAAGGVRVADALARMVEGDEPLVAEAAAFALGELSEVGLLRGQRPGGPVEVLAAASGSHTDPLVREACVAALGSLGEPHTLRAVLAALADRPPVRRRAVLALAAFEGPEVDAALRRCLEDRDWQVRQAAEDLLG